MSTLDTKITKLLGLNVIHGKNTLVKLHFPEGYIYSKFNHIFPTRPLTDKGTNKVINAFNNKIKKIGPLYFKNNPHMHVVQIQENPDNFKFDNAFFKGNYLKQLKWNFADVGSIIELPVEIMQKIQNKKELNSNIDNLYNIITKNFSKGYATRVLNYLLFDKNISISEKNIELLKQNQEFNNLIQSFNKISKNDIILKNKKFELVLNSLDGLNKIGQETYGDFLNQKFTFLDIEKPLYDTIGEISWVGMSHWNNFQQNQMIHSIHDVDNVIHSKNQEELIGKVEDSIIDFDARFLIAYNAPYDFLELREKGMNEVSPKIKSSNGFSKIIDFSDRTIIDLLKVMQRLYDYLPNQKLETVAKEVGIKFSKTITYQQMKIVEKKLKSYKITEQEEKQLQELTKNNSIDNIIAEYLKQDVKVLPDLFFSQEVQDFFKLSNLISQHYGINIKRVVESENFIDDIIEKSFFNKKSTYKDKMFGFENQQKEKEKFNDYYNEFVTFNLERKNGIYQKLYRNFIPYGNFFEKTVVREIPELKFIYDLKPKNELQKYVLDKMKVKVAQDFMQSYLNFKKYNEQKKDKLKKLGIDENQFENNIYLRWDNLSNRKKNNILKRNLFKIRLNYKDFNDLNAFKDSLKNRKDFDFNNYKNKLKDLIELFSYKVAEDRFIDSLYKKYQVSVHEIDKNITSYVEKCNKVFNNNFVARKGMFFYTTEKIDGVFSEELNNVIVTEDKVYYNKNDVIKSYKVKNEPSYNSSMFEMNTIGSFLNNIFNSNIDLALEGLEKNMLKLENINNEDLMYNSSENQRKHVYVNGKRQYFRMHDMNQNSSVYEQINNKRQEVLLLNDISELKLDHEKYRSKISDKVIPVLNLIEQDKKYYQKVRKIKDLLENNKQMTLL